MLLDIIRRMLLNVVGYHSIDVVECCWIAFNGCCWMFLDIIQWMLLNVVVYHSMDVVECCWISFNGC